MTEPILAEPPIFIVGAGRSGTTLVRTLLSAHPRIAVPPETHFLRFAERQGAVTGLEAVQPSFWKALEGFPRFADADVPIDRVRGLAEGEGEATYRSVFAAILAAYAERHGKARAGEKTPGHYRDIGRLLDWFPETRILYVVRDPRAVTASALSAPWVTERMDGLIGPRFTLKRYRFNHVAGQARGWRRIYGQVLPRWRDHPQVRVVSYEKLVTDPDTEVRAICRFLDIDWDPVMIEGRGDVSGAAKGAGWKEWTKAHEQRAAGPISAKGTEKWRDLLTPFEIGAIEEVCRDAMSALTYEPSQSVRHRVAGGLAAKATMTAYRTEDRLRGLVDGLARRPNQSVEPQSSA